MATISINQGLDVSGSDLVSAYNDNVLQIRFIPDDAGKAITVKIKVGTEGQLLDCYNYLGQYYRINIKEIIRYYMTDFYYKAVSDGINTSTLVGSLTINYYGYEDGVVTASGSVTYRFGHGINQIGNAYGGNLKSLHDGEDLSYSAFNGYPFELYFYCPASYTLVPIMNNTVIAGTSAHTEGLKTLKDAALDVVGKNDIRIVGGSGAEMITSWGNGSPGFNTFSASVPNISIASESTEDGAICFTSNMSFTAGLKYLIQFTLTKSDPTSDTPIVKIGTQEIPFIWGSQTNYIFIPSSTGNLMLSITYIAGQAGTFYGTFSIKSGFEQIINLNVKRTDREGLYVRYLSREGFYRYWLFNKYYKSSRQGKLIGYTYPQITTLVGQQYRRRVAGYEESFEQLSAISHNVSQAEQERLIDLFTSPAVYIWNGAKGSDSAEADWIQVEVTGSHEINRKKAFQQFEATFIKPELYTQQI